MSGVGSRRARLRDARATRHNRDRLALEVAAYRAGLLRAELVLERRAAGCACAGELLDAAAELRALRKLGGS